MRVRAGQSPPFLTIPEEAVRATAWMTDRGPLPQLHHDWDPATPLQLSRTLHLDCDLVARSLHLERTSQLGVGCTWQSSSTRLRGTSRLITKDLSELEQVTVDLAVPRFRVGGTLQIKTVVIVVRGEPASKLAPTANGAIVWEARDRVILEGDAARFPVAVVDFSELPGVPSDASWYLSWPTRDYSEPWGASIRLLVNSKNREVRQAVTGEDDEGAAIIRRQVKFDTARTLITNALREEEFLGQYTSFEDDSVGGVIRTMIELNWGAQADPRALAASLADDPSRFEAKLQSLFLKAR